MKFVNFNCIIILFTFSFKFAQTEPCLLENDKLGNCVPIRSCQSAIDQLRKKIIPVTCRFEENYPIVCCPTNSDPRLTSIINQIQSKCEEIKKLHPEKNAVYLIGGVDVPPREYIHMAALGYGPEDDIKYLCGGTLISDKYILTAAHCVKISYDRLVSWARLGDLDLKNQEENEEIQDFRILNRIIHPDYIRPQKYNDIALLELNRPARFTPFVLPACLHVGNNLENSTKYYATGWGLVEVGGEQSDYLQEVQLELFTNEECNNAYAPNQKNLKDGIIESQFCAGGRTDRRDTCQGDSGGPLQYKNYLPNPSGGYKGYTIYGITSFGKICGIINHPGVYTKVSSFLPWIYDNVWKNL